MLTLKTSTRSRPARALLGAAGIAILATLPGACTTGNNTLASAEPTASHDYRKRHPILISNEPETLTIPVGMRGPALSAEIETALSDYVLDYVARGTGGVTIQVPSESANEIAARETGRAVHYALVRAGVPRSAISVVPYQVGSYASLGAVRVSFLKVKAVTPKCGLWPSDLASSADNSQYENLGCAYQQNMAAMVANPADLVRPREMGPANGARRAHVIGTYEELGNGGWQPTPETKLLNSTGVGE